MIDLNQDLAAKLSQAAEIIQQSRYLVALAGAGLSVESGIPPFRGPGGLWTKYGEPSMLSYQEFINNPAQWWESRLNEEMQPGSPTYELKIAIDQAVPNPGHYALVTLEQQGVLKQVITQNVDNLHRLAGSAALVEIHGNRAWLRCVDCGGRRERAGFIFGDLPPRCPECAGVIKLDTVMFGEPIPPSALQDCYDATARCDCMLLVGSSGTVRPAATLPLLARENGATLIEINPEVTALTSHCHLTLNGPSGEILPLLVDQLNLRPIE